MKKAGGGQIPVGINLTMSQEAPMPPASRLCNAHAYNPNIRNTKKPKPKYL